MRSRIRVRLTVAAAVTAAVVSACGGPRNSLNTDASVCFRSLAVASDAVHHKGKLVGVRRVSARQLAGQMPEATTHGKDPVCLVAFESAYGPGDVADAHPAVGGRYAVVAVTTGAPVLLGARVSDSLPLRFHHRT